MTKKLLWIGTCLAICVVAVSHASDNSHRLFLKLPRDDGGTTSLSGTNEICLPFNSDFTTAEELAQAIEADCGCTGVVIQRFNRDDKIASYVEYDTVYPGTNFLLNPGESYRVVVPTTIDENMMDIRYCTPGTSIRCNSDDECNALNVCQLNGMCSRTPDTCDSNDDCTWTNQCTPILGCQQSLETECTNDDDCAEGDTCVQIDLRCAHTDDSCQADSDCPQCMGVWDNDASDSKPLLACDDPSGCNEYLLDLTASASRGTEISLLGSSEDSTGVQSICLPYDTSLNKASDVKEHVNQQAGSNVFLSLVRFMKQSDGTEGYSNSSGPNQDFELVPGEGYRIQVSSPLDFVVPLPPDVAVEEIDILRPGDLGYNPAIPAEEQEDPAPLIPGDAIPDQPHPFHWQHTRKPACPNGAPGLFVYSACSGTGCPSNGPSCPESNSCVVEAKGCTLEEMRDEFPEYSRRVTLFNIDVNDDGAKEQVAREACETYRAILGTYYDNGSQKLYGWYHTEGTESPVGGCNNGDISPQEIGRVGMAWLDESGPDPVWEDLGIVLTGPTSSLDARGVIWFAGGYAEPTAGPRAGSGDPQDPREFIYFTFNSYRTEIESQGIGFARVDVDDLDAPGDKVEVYANGSWNAVQSPRCTCENNDHCPDGSMCNDGYCVGEAGRCSCNNDCFRDECHMPDHDLSSVFPPSGSHAGWHTVAQDAAVGCDLATNTVSDLGVDQPFWGGSVHYNTALESYVMVLTESSDRDPWPSGAPTYISFNQEIWDPSAWTLPLQIPTPAQCGAFSAQLVGTELLDTDKFVTTLEPRMFHTGCSDSRAILTCDSSSDEDCFCGACATGGGGNAGGSGDCEEPTGTVVVDIREPCD